MLIDIRCPKIITKRNGKGEERQEVCGRLAIKAEPGSAGEVYCNRCHETFDFKIESTKQPTIAELLANVT